jgi:hypothetical protein
MKTYPALSEIELRILGYCQSFPSSPVISDEILELIHPHPLYSACKNLAEYHVAEEQWKILAYGGTTMSAAESFNSICRQACDHLVKLGYMLENNCGYGKIKYFITQWGLKYEVNAR